jgi:superfamily II DNA helicase RecQ
MPEYEINDIIVQNLEFQVLICKLCHAAVQGGATVESHFRRVHKLTGDIIRDVRDYYGELPCSNPQNAKVPIDGSRPIAELDVQSGYSCNQCRFLTIAHSNITTHLRTADHIRQDTVFRDVRLQTWKPGRYAKYWIVTEVGDGELNVPPRWADHDAGTQTDTEHAVEPARSQLEIILDESQTRLEAEDTQRLRRGDAKENIDRDSAWVKDMKWVSHFGDRDLTSIAEATDWLGSRARKAESSQEDANEEAVREKVLLQRVSDAFEREVQRCQLRIPCVPKETLQRLQGITANSSIGIPFGQSGIDTSIRKYNLIGQRYLCFCIRAYRLGREEATSHLGMVFTDEQWSLMGDVLHEAEDDRLASVQVQDNGYVSEMEDDAENTWRGGHGSNTEGGGGIPITSELDRAVFLFMVASIHVRVGGHMYNNALLCFCAAMGIRRNPAGFQSATLYTGILAGLHWLTRLFFLESIFADEPRELHEVRLPALERFEEEFANWMCIGTYTALSKIINWMAYGKGHRQKAEGQPSVRWAEDRETIYHSGEGVTVQDFQRTACSIVSEADELLNDLLGGQWGTIVASVNMRRISDDMVRRGAGQSFATNPVNRWLEPGPHKAIVAAGTQLWDARTSRWKSGGIKKWMRQLRLFREALLIAVHIWGGQPGRGPEVMTLRHCDSWQLLRNIFVYDGALLLVTDRDKMKAIRGIGRKVARFLPERLGQIMVAYIAWLLPAERALLQHAKMPEPRPADMEYIWRHGHSARWETERLSMALASKTQAGVGVRLTVGRYRMVAIAMGRQIRGIAERKAEQAAGEADDDEDMDVDPLTGEVADTSGSWNIVWDLQSTHSTTMARQHYAVQVGFIGRLQPEMIASYQGVSRLWHQFLERGNEHSGHSRKMGHHGVAKRKHSASAEEQSGPGKRRNPGPRSMDSTAESIEQEEEMVGGLRQLLGPRATWKSTRQKDAMREILQLQGDTVAICVLPTGAGKSILFMLPAMLCEGGTSVVVVPFVALLDDLVERARTFGVDVIRFDTGANIQRESIPRAARLVVVSADVASSEQLLMYVDGLRGNGLLRRIFIDECHTIITDAGYRAKLTALVGLRRFECPVVLLSATLPVVFESWFRREMLAERASIVRDRTTKKNCRYRVEKVERTSGAVEAKAIQLIQEFGRTMLRGQKGVVYCRSKAQCEALAEEIGCPFHHSGMPEEARVAAWATWASGRGHRWIVATTGLGTGIDIPGITAVVHVEQPYGLVDFIQQTGRGGRREGEVVDSVIVHDGRPVWTKLGANFIEKSNQAQMDMFVQADQCRRSVVGSFMDGEANETCRDIPGAIACDNCAARLDEEASDPSSDSRPAGPWREFQQEQGQRLRVVRRWLDEVTDACPACHVLNHERLLRPGRTWQEKFRCEGGKRCYEVMLGADYKTIRQKIRFGAQACCYQCKLPLDWCQESRVESTTGEVACAYIDKILPVVLLAGCIRGIQRIAQEEGGCKETSDLDEFYSWLGEGRRFHNTNGANIHTLWEEIIWQVYKGGIYWWS